MNRTWITGIIGAGAGVLWLVLAAVGMNGCTADQTAAFKAGTDKVQAAATQPVVAGAVTVVTAANPALGLTLSGVLAGVITLASIAGNIAQQIGKSNLLAQHATLQERIVSLNRLLPVPTAAPVVVPVAEPVVPKVAPAPSIAAAPVIDLPKT